MRRELAGVQYPFSIAGNFSATRELTFPTLYSSPCNRPQPSSQRHPVREGVPLGVVPARPGHGGRRLGGAAGGGGGAMVRGRPHQVRGAWSRPRRRLMAN